MKNETFRLPCASLYVINNFRILIIKVVKMDWNLCFICQKNCEENLRCPNNSTRPQIQENGYVTISKNILEFRSLNAMPVEMKIELFAGEETEPLEVKLKRVNAKFHKSCYNKFSSMKLDRERKRKQATVSTGEPSKVKRRSSTEVPLPHKKLCFFVEMETIFFTLCHRSMWIPK